MFFSKEEDMECREAECNEKMEIYPLDFANVHSQFLIIFLVL